MKDIFLSVLDQGIAAGWVILVVLAVRLCLRRVPKKYVCLLWIPVGVRLVLPWRISSPVSLFNLIRPGAAEVTKYGTTVQRFIPGDIGMAADPQISIGIPAADAVLSGSLPDATPMVSMNPMQFWEIFGTAVWCAGMAVMLLWTLVQYIRLRLRVRTAVRMEGNVYLSENVPSPFILGILRPKIYLPYGMDETMTKQVLLHERMHLRRWDPATKLLAFGILTVYWFHPLCWLAFVLFCRDLEMRCDEAALEQTDAKVYGKALVSAASGRQYSVTGPIAFGESSVKERVAHILAWRKPALWVSICAVAVSVVLLAVCGTDGMEDPWRQVQALREEEILEVSVMCHVEGGVYQADLTKEQTEAFLVCLQKVPEEDIRAGKPDTHFEEKVMTVTVRLTGVNGQSYHFTYGEGKFFLRPVRPFPWSYASAWYYKDTDLLAYLAELEQIVLQGQGTLDPISAGVSVYVSGTDTVIAPKHYEAGQWEQDYNELPSLTMTEAGHLCIHVYWQPETLYVYEEYYNSLSSSATTIRSTMYTADGPHADGGYTIPVTRRNSALDERAVYYIENGEEKYIFKVNFTDTPMEDSLYVYTVADCPSTGTGLLTDDLYMVTSDTDAADAYLKSRYGADWDIQGIRIFRSSSGQESHFWYPMYSAGEMYKMMYVSISGTGSAASSYVLSSTMWDAVESLAPLTSPEEPMVLVQEGEILYALIGNTAYWLPQVLEPEKRTLSLPETGSEKGNVVVISGQR